MCSPDVQAMSNATICIPTLRRVTVPEETKQLRHRVKRDGCLSKLIRVLRP
jgi:hypothetical protein